MISIRQITKRFGDTQVLCGVDLTLLKGKLMGLIGPSGSGKSLLTRCIVGLEPFDAGIVEYNGHGLGPRTDRFAHEAIQLRRDVGIVFPVGTVAPYRTAEELILEGPIYVRQMSRRAARDYAAKWIDRLQIREHIKKFPRELSTGQLARVTLARALSLEPKYLIADEITANLDPILAGEVIEIIGELVSEGIGVLVVTHQINFIRTHAASVAFLMNGRIVEEGDPAGVLDEPKSPDLRDFLNGVRRGR